MRFVYRVLRFLIWLAILAAAALIGYALLGGRPSDLPWIRLDLGQPIGLFTGRKLAGLTEDPKKCEALLDQAGVAFRALPPRHPSGEAQCGYDDAVRMLPGGAQQIAYRPASLGPSCPVVAALALWEWRVVQPAAQEHFGAEVTRIDTFGSYNCRRMYGRTGGSWSEHATADAIDIAAFVLTDGRRISVVGDWAGEGEESAFLHDVRDGACKLFATVLSPDYNAAHHDHLHLDQAERGTYGGRACR